MKTVCKKLFCLMLVALMLVSAVPFAFAAEAVDVTVIYEEINGDENVVDNAVYDDLTSISAVLNAFGSWSGYEITNWEVQGEHAATGSTDGSVNLVGATHVWIRVAKPAASCQHPNKETTNDADCTNAGTKIVVCKDCGATISTEKVPALGHDYNGATCEECGATRDPKGSITFHYMTSALNWAEKTILVYENGEEVTPPAEADDIRGFKFLGWSSVRNGAVEVMEGNLIGWNSGTSKDYWAAYDDDADDNLVHLTVKVAYYVNGKLNNTETLLTSGDFAKSEKTNQMFRWLYGEGFNEINNALFADGSNVNYKWNEVFYLNNKGTDKVETDMKDDGNKIVYVVLNSKDYIEANVQLYLHKKTSKGYDLIDIIDMDGYTAGNTVTRSDVIDTLKDNKYSYDGLSYLYDATEWENLVQNEDNADGDKEISITHNGTTKIHVYVKSATQKSNADSSNPKTGDSIMVAVTTMTLAAAALVAVVELKKRKMI